MNKNKEYWDAITEEYQQTTRIDTDDFHYGPLIPGDKTLHLLPDIKGRKCLEIGCGAAQNSIYLAKMGAECVAFDISEEQIRYARNLMAQENVEIDLHCTSMESPAGIDGKFDFIHSVYAISFAENPEEVAKFAADHLNDDGYFLLATGHPLAQSEWMELDDEQGIFLQDYFNVDPDIRYNEDGDEEICSKTYPLSVISRWITDAGMSIAGLYEPFVDSAALDKSPYYSEQWAEYAKMFSHVPGVVIFLCRKAKK